MTDDCTSKEPGFRDGLLKPLQNCSAATLFLAVAIPFGCLWIFLIPPLQTPDEHNHLCRAWMLSRGQLMPNFSADLKRAGAILPSSLHELSNALGTDDMMFRSTQKLDMKSYWEAWHIGIDTGQQVFYRCENTIIYPPICYLPQSIVMFFTDHLHAPLLLGVYLVRLLNFGLFCAVVAIALRKLPFLWAPFLLLALMPMTLQQAFAAGSDAILLSAAILYVSLLMRFQGADKSPSKFEYAALVVAACAIALCKLVYLPMCFLLLLVTPRGTNRNVLIKRSVPVIIAFLLAVSWFFIIREMRLPTAAGVRSPIRLAMEQPSRVLTTVPRNIALNLISPQAHQMVYGALGWLDTRLPLWLAYPYFAAIFAGCVRSRRTTPIHWIKLLGITIVGIVTFFLIHGAVLLYANREIYFIQGRYLLPLLPISFYIIYQLAQRTRIQAKPLPILVWLGIVTVSLVASTIKICLRYYG